jgi:hypothetical protein
VIDDGPYIPLNPGDPLPDPSDPTDPTFIAQKPLRKRYTANFPLTEEIRAVDLLYKIVFPVAKLFMRVNKFGRYEIRSEQPSDSTRLRTATAIGDTAIPLLDVTPWKIGPDLLQGRVLLGFGLTTSEVRTPTAAVFSTSGNSVTLAVSKTGTVTIAASGATLTGGSTTVQASGTITIGGTPAAGNTVTATIGGIAVTYTLDAGDTTGTTAAMLSHYINANQRLNKFIRATWSVSTPTVVTLQCLHGALTVPALLLPHTIGISDPSAAPTVAAAAGALAAGVYKVAYSDVTASGSTALTPLASITLTANQQINLSSLPALTGTSRDFYVSEKANSTNLKFIVSRTNNSNFSINSLPLPGAAIPPSSNTTAEELIRVAFSFATNSQDVYPTWQGSSVVVLNDIYLPTMLNGHKYKVTTAGTTGATEPTWPTGVGATVASGSAVFTEFGSTVLQQAGLTRANVKKDTYKWPLGSKQSSVNQIKGNFRDAKNDFALTPFKFNDRAHQDQVKKVYPLDVDLSAVDSVDQVARIGGWLLSKNREGDWFNSLATGPQGLVLEEGDVICASDDSGGLINIVTRIEDLRIKPNHDVEINTARRYSTEMFSDDVGAHRIPLASTLKYVQTKDSIAQFIDSPPLHDRDALTPGFYLVVTHDLGIDGDARGWALWADFGDGYTFITSGDVPATIGTASTTLGSVTNIIPIDTTNTVTFSFKYEDPFPSLVTCTEADLVANPYRNLLLIGNEYVQAKTVSRAGANITVSNLFRARFNTKSAVTHGAGERVVLINGAEKLIPLSTDRLNLPFNYKVVTTNQDVADATPISFTWTGQILKALPIDSITGTFDLANGSLALDWLDNLTAVPTADDAFELVIRSAASGGGTVLRGPVTIKPLDLARVSNTPPLIADDPFGLSLPLTSYTYVDPGGFDALYTKAQWNTSELIVTVNSPSLKLTGGVFIEMQVPLGFDPLTNVLVPNFFGLNDNFGITDPTGAAMAGWRFDRADFEVGEPITVRPEGTLTGEHIYEITSGDRLAVSVQADGTIVFYVNYNGASSNPWWVSPFKLDMDLLYQVRIANSPAFNIAGTTVTVGVRNVRWIRNIPEYAYTGDMQVEDYGSLPTDIFVGVRKKSSHPLGPPSDWLYATFTRP